MGDRIPADVDSPTDNSPTPTDTRTDNSPTRTDNSRTPTDNSRTRTDNSRQTGGADGAPGRGVGLRPHEAASLSVGMGVHLAF